MISPIRPATTTELRGLRAVAFAATPAVEHAGELDLLRLGEELPRLEPVLLERSAPLFHRQEQRAEGQALGRGRAAQLGTDLIRLLIDRVELLLVGGDLLPEGVDFQLRVSARDGGDLGGDRIGRRAHLAALRPFDRHCVELVRRAFRSAALDRPGRHAGAKLSHGHARRLGHLLQRPLSASELANRVRVRRRSLNQLPAGAIRRAHVHRGLRAVHVLAAEGDEIADRGADDEACNGQPPAGDERVEVPAEVDLALGLGARLRARAFAGRGHASPGSLATGSGSSSANGSRRPSLPSARQRSEKKRVMTTPSRNSPTVGSGRSPEASASASSG